MSFVRDRDARTRGVNAIAALDHVSSRGQQLQRARALQMAQRDARLARVALGAVDTRNMGGSTRPTVRPDMGPRFDYGLPIDPTTTGTGRPPGGGTQPPRPTFRPSMTTTKIPQSITQPRTRPTKPTEPAPPVPPLPPPPVVVTDSPSGKPPKPVPVTGGGGGGGGGGGSEEPGMVIDPVPDTIEPTPSSAPSSNTKFLVGAGLLIGAYYLFKKKA